MPMRQHLLWKLVGIQVVVIGLVITLVWLAIDYRAAAYFIALMERYHITPTLVHQMFLQAVHWYLVWASLVALVCALLLSTLLIRTVLRPLFQMITVAGNIAAGDYTARVDITSTDEVSQLARAFNQMAESLQRLEQQRKAMVTDIAHELRTPLTNIRGYLEALSDGVIPPAQDTFALLQEETFRLVTLADDLLQLARADAAQTTLRRQPVHLWEVITQVLALFRVQFAEKAITIETQGTEGTDVVQADPDKLTQVVHNLLQNAWQYTPTGGRVRVTMERGTAHVRVTVANTGEGIAPVDLPFIFDRFYRGEKSRSRAHGGEGIGLAIVKALIDAHGGKVGAESVPGETQVWFTLPVA
jgi:two-component system sensor histidine kinase BaeS